MKTTFSVLGLLMLLMISCQQEPTLQKYFVEKAGSKNFVTLDIAPTIIKTEKLSLTPEEQTALKSLHKFNVLAFTATPKNQAEYKKEKDKVKALLKGEEYEELMHVGSNEQGASIHTIGEGEHIEEFVVYVHKQENGFGVIRVLGEDMTPNNVMTLVGILQKADMNMEQLKPLQAMMKQ